MILDSHPTIPIIGHANDGVELGLFAGIFSDIPVLLESPARFLSLPTVLALNSIRGIIAIWDYLNSFNRNLTRTAKAALEIVKVSLIGTAIIGSLAGVTVLAALAPFLFIAATGLNALYHAAKVFFHGYKWAASPFDNGRKYHKQQFIHNLVSSVTSLIALAAITLLLAVKPELGIFKSVVIYATAISIGVSALWSGAQAYFSFAKKRENSISPQVSMENTAGEEPRSLASPKPKVATLRPEIKFAPVKPKITYHTADLVEQMLALPNQKDFILEVIAEKVFALQAQKNDGLNIFQNSKRQKKIDVLLQLEGLMKGESIILPHEQKRLTTPGELLAFLKESKNLNDVFSSFFSEVGEVQKIFLLADTYFTNHPFESNDEDVECLMYMGEQNKKTKPERIFHDNQDLVLPTFGRNKTS
jgi:hypothetical protein